MATEHRALLLIDFQAAFDDPAAGSRNNPDAERNALLLLARWRETNRPIVHIQHSSIEPGSALRPDSPGHAFKPGFEPAAGEMWLSKRVNSAFIGTPLETALDRAGIRSLVIAGLTTDHCVSTSTRMAGNLGFDVILAGDATAAFERQAVDGTRIDAETVHRVNLASLDHEFCRVYDTEAIVASIGG
ncbi:cysteine hydrolase family protein [Salinisphaera hydrothermalis]|uniref:cysteine hydrolase family protein n=1 Tax=Salinisphaera hydrothermalis TaxID=563188 RepID=UPI003341A33B